MLKYKFGDCVRVLNIDEVCDLEIPMDAQDKDNVMYIGGVTFEVVCVVPETKVYGLRTPLNWYSLHFVREQFLTKGDPHDY